MTEQGQLSFQRNDDSTLLKRLSGAWRLKSGLPSTSLIDRELQSAAHVSSIVFDVGQVTSWDSSVLTFLVELSDLCRRRGIDMDRKGLPAGACAVFNSAPNLPRSYKTLSIGLRKALSPSHLTEEILHHLEGYSGSYPVRIGNNAYNQL